MRKTRVALSTIKKAVAKAHAVYGKGNNDWLAEYLEILLIPAVNAKWKALNDNYPDLSLNRVAGKSPLNASDVSDWSEYAGYTLTYHRDGDKRWGWNSVKSDYYGHSPNTTWDGVRRETIHRFVEVLRDIAYGGDPNSPHNWTILFRAKVEVTGVEEKAVA